MFKLLAMAAMLTTQAASFPAPAAGPRCLTREQAGSMGVVGAAIMVNVAHNACRRHLRPSAFLLSASGTAFVAAMQEDGRRRLPSFLAGLSAMSPGRESALSAGFFRGLATGLLNDDGGVDWADYADPQICRDADEMIAVMAELTPAQMGRFTGAFMSLSDSLSRAVMRAMRERPPVYVPAPEPVPGVRPAPTPRPLSYEVQGRNAGKPEAVPVPVIVAPPAPPPPRPPLICPDSE